MIKKEVVLRRRWLEKKRAHDMIKSGSRLDGYLNTHTKDLPPEIVQPERLQTAVQ